MAVRKCGAIFILAIFLVVILSISSFSAYDSEAGKEKSSEKSSNTRVSKVNEKIKELRQEHREEIEKLKEEQKEKFKELRQEELEKVAKLKEERLKKLSSLREDQIKKLAEIKSERLKKMTGLSEEQLKKIALLDERQLEKLARLGRIRLNEIANLSFPDIRARLGRLEIKNISNETGLNERAIAKEIKESAKKVLKEKEIELAKIKEDFKSLKKAFADSKSSGNETQSVEQAKAYVLRLADVVVNHLEKLKERVSSSDKITDAEEKEILADIDSMIKQINDGKALVEKSATKEEVKENGRVIVKAWKIIQQKISKHKLRLEHGQVQAVIKRAEQLENRLDNVLDEIEDKNVTIAGLDAKINLFSAGVNEARKLYAQAEDLFKQAKQLRDEDVDKAGGLVKKSRDLLQEAQQKLKSAHNLLVDIINEIKKAGGDVEKIEKISSGSEDAVVVG